ncbi:hypothetical protein NSK11_contig00227-0004 [Nocardia seriolae]|uniref:Uncharacterized protein n=1 Tax=Nocardia seriolae TaxID=37332 RepID=A0ABC9Z6J2_9NOCA|nr:hypothetical protein NS07_v2contig00227-0004 [Nocardia seriolae]GAP33235.1 hypothetical protein NSK11_contig00227-0004 [Nocardia seriolae]
MGRTTVPDLFNRQFSSRSVERAQQEQSSYGVTRTRGRPFGGQITYTQRADHHCYRLADLAFGNAP